MSGPTIFKKSMKLIGARRSALSAAHTRLGWIRFAFALVFVLMAIRVTDLTIVQGQMQRHGETAEPIYKTRITDERPVRADILDRNGVILATSLKTPSLYADPLLISDPAGVAEKLVAILPDLSYGEVLEKLQRRGRFVWVKRNLTPAEQFEVLTLGEPGLDFKEEWQRLYPQGGISAHLVGYTSVDGQGLAGVEHSFDRLLSQGDRPLHLSLDVRLQHILRREIQRMVETFSAKGGVGVILDMTSGEVLAGVSLPDFDPHNISAAPDSSAFNQLTLGVYELGSTFKVFSTAALLEFTNAEMSTKFDGSNSLKRGRFTISDYHALDRTMTVPEVFIHSSNIGAALMGEAVGTELLRNFYKDLGFDAPLSLEISEVGAPIFPDPWRDIHTVTASYGHGIAISPLQMVTAASSIVAGGTVVSPTLIARTDQTVPQKDPDIRLVSPQTSHRMRQLMRLTVTDGTGTQADVPGYLVGGKTGTAEKPGVGGYDRKRLLSSFLGFFPMNAPRYAVYVMINEPKGTKESFGYATGGWVAAPAVGGTIAGMAAVLGIEPYDPSADESLIAGIKRYVKDKNEHADKKEGHQLVSY